MARSRSPHCRISNWPFPIHPAEDRREIEVGVDMIGPAVQFAIEPSRHGFGNIKTQLRPTFSATDAVQPRSPKIGLIEHAVDICPPYQAVIGHGAVECYIERTIAIRRRPPAMNLEAGTVCSPSGKTHMDIVPANWSFDIVDVDRLRFDQTCRFYLPQDGRDVEKSEPIGRSS